MAPNKKKVKCDTCNKEMFQTNLKRHQKTCKGNPENKDQKRPNRKSTNFVATFQKPIKYEICKRLRLPFPKEKRPKWLRAVTVGNEWGSGYKPKGHTHAIFGTNEPGYSLEEMKAELKKIRIIPDDFQVAKSVRDSVHYFSKEDYKCVSEGHDKDFLSVQCRAYLYSLKYKKFIPTSYPYCHLGPHQQKKFKECLEQFYLEQEMDALTEKIDQVDLWEWQKNIIQKLKNQDDRKVIWIHDDIGGRGKTHLAKYLATKEDAMICHNASTKDIALAYQKQPIVVFDYTRTEDSINYAAIEHLKNGVIFSAKYQSAVKFFNPPKVICLSNNLPDVTGLSRDRWDIYTFNADGELCEHNV